MEEIPCPKCGITTNDLQLIKAESWEDDGVTLTGKLAFKVRSLDIAAYCPSCTSSVHRMRLMATVVAAIPLWFFGAVSVLSNSGTPLLAMGLYGLYLLKKLEYTWADKILYGWELEQNLHNKTNGLRPDLASVIFPVGCLFSIARFFFYVVSPFFVAFLAGYLAFGLGGSGRSSPAQENFKYADMPSREIVDKLLWNLDFGNLDAVKQILNNNEKILEFKDKDGASLLHLAARKNRKEGLQILLDKGLKIEALDQAFSFTPLHFAAQSGTVDSAKFLLERGATLDAAGKGGKTPLFVAVENRRYEVCALLIKRGANVNVKSDRGQTPLAVAKSNRYGELISLLKKHGGKE